MEASAERRNLRSAEHASTKRRGFSIFLKLLVVIVSLVLGVSALLASYLISSQVSEMRANLETKAATYARLTAKQVASAIAFDDRETAREVFDSLAEDQDIESLTLFTSKGAILHARGAVSGALPAELKRVSDVRTFALADRIGVAVPVVSLEGPRGTLVVELSTLRLSESRAQVLRHAALAGLLAGLAGAFGAFLIARSLGRRLGAIASVANAVAAGDLAQTPVSEDQAQDEIGVMAAAFNAMLRQLRSLIAQIRESAREEQSRLETLVEARTAELFARNDDMRRVLDNVGQGFFTLDRAGQISRERSAVLETWFGPAPKSGSFVDYLGAIDGAFAEWFAVSWESVLAGELPLEVTLDQLPKRFSCSGRQFELEYRPVLGEGGELERVVVVLSDVTAALDGARAETDEREATRLFTRLIADRAGFLEFFAEAHALVESIQTEPNAAISLSRSLHTLKGNAALYGIDTLAELCHGLEDRLAQEGTLAEADIRLLVTRWSALSTKVRTLVGDERNGIEIDDAAYREVLAAVERGVARPQLREMMLAWRLEPTEVRLRRIAEQAEALALRLGKGPISVRIESNQLRLAPERFSTFWSATVHVLRNAIDHGLEPAAERSLRNKPPSGGLILRTRLQGDTFAVEFSDDGRGIAWDVVKRNAAALGLATGTQAELVQALFADGLSTRDTVTDISGRGIGLGAARRACQELGGTVEVESEAGRGTTVRFVWPSHLLSASNALPFSPSRPSPPASLQRVG
jgi:two-component system chemotaxis sensor kinase CheA